MLRQSITKTDLAKQEAEIEAWKKANNWQEKEVVNANKTQWNLPFVSSKPKAEPTPKAKVLQKSEPVTTPKPKAKAKPKPKADLSKYKRFTASYGELQGSSVAKKLIWLLDKYDYIDVTAFLNEYKLSRNAFLKTAKSLEKLGVLRMIKDGKEVVYLERVA